MYFAVVLIHVCKPLVYCESPSRGVHTQTNDYTERRLYTAYKTNIRTWVQTPRGFLHDVNSVLD